MPTQGKAWKGLSSKANELNSTSASELYRIKPQEKFISSTQDLVIDYRHQRVNEEIMDLLFHLAIESQLQNEIEALFSGKIVNSSENRPALHTALRTFDETPIIVNQKNIIPDIFLTRQKMQDISNEIRAKKWLGYSGKPIVSIVNIGIGGSDLGPKFCLNALSAYCNKDLSYHFVSDANPDSFENAVEDLNPETTLFIISSKSFTTTETLYNAKKAKAWIGTQTGSNRHFIAVTANEEKALQFGVDKVLSIWDWVGGRFSFCSAVNLIAAIAMGMDNFNLLLQGAARMDEHYLKTEFNDNLPVILALLGIWNINFLNYNNLLMLTYSNQLEKFVSYIQQLDMESNGKSMNKNNQLVNYSTGPIIWGGSGNQAQHSYYQSICQGTHKIAVDLLSFKQPEYHFINTFCNAKIKVLSEGISSENNRIGFIKGKNPLNHIQLMECSPDSIGALLALYEHKIYTQAVIWKINPFDQPGVESAKQLFPVRFEASEMI